MAAVSNLQWFAGQVEARMAEETAASQVLESGPDDEVLTLAEAAKVARVSTRTLYRVARAGEGPFYKVGAQWRVDASALNDWMRGRDQVTVAKPATGVLAEVEAIREGSK